MEELFPRTRHVKYFVRCLQVLPGTHASQDTNRMTIAFFAISGLDLLDALASLPFTTQQITDWIYALQILPSVNVCGEAVMDSCGFRGSPSLGAVFTGPQAKIPHDCSHIAMTYTALTSLIILGDDFTRVDRKAVVSGLASLQLADGSFSSTLSRSENDMRYVYCAACVCYILDDFSTINTVSAVQYIVSSLTYEGAFGQGSYLEAHGGSTFCAVASLWLLGQLDTALTEKQLAALTKWCLLRQESGFQGRPNKPADTCYSFWIGATLKLLDAHRHMNNHSNKEFLLSTQDPIIGGFSKWPSSNPDPLHSYMGLAGLSIIGSEFVLPLFAPLNISQRAASHLHSLQKTWRCH